MDVNQVVSQFTGHDIVSLFVKSFAILLSVMYILYAIVLSRQTKVMNDTVHESLGVIFTLGSSLQILVGAILLVLAITLT